MLSDELAAAGNCFFDARHVAACNNSGGACCAQAGPVSPVNNRSAAKFFLTLISPVATSVPEGEPALRRNQWQGAFHAARRELGVGFAAKTNLTRMGREQGGSPGLATERENCQHTLASSLRSARSRRRIVFWRDRQLESSAAMQIEVVFLVEEDPRFSPYSIDD